MRDHRQHLGAVYPHASATDPQVGERAVRRQRPRGGRDVPDRDDMAMRRPVRPEPAARNPGQHQHHGGRPGSVPDRARHGRFRGHPGDGHAAGAHRQRAVRRQPAAGAAAGAPGDAVLHACQQRHRAPGARLSRQDPSQLARARSPAHRERVGHALLGAGLARRQRPDGARHRLATARGPFRRRARGLDRARAAADQCAAGDANRGRPAA